MDLEGIILSEISQTETDKYCMISLICGIQKIQQTSEYNNNNNRLIVVEKTLWLPVGSRKGGGQHRGRGLRGTNYYV